MKHFLLSAVAAATLALVLTAGGTRHSEWVNSKFAGGDPDAAVGR